MTEAPDPVEAEFLRGIQLRKDGDLAGSFKLLTEVLETRTRLCGANSLATQVAMSQLGRTCRAMGRHAEAIRLHRESLAIRIRALGDNDERVWNSRAILLETLLEADHEAEAVTMCVDAIRKDFAELAKLMAAVQRVCEGQRVRSFLPRGLFGRLQGQSETAFGATRFPPDSSLLMPKPRSLDDMLRSLKPPEKDSGMLSSS